MTDSTTPDAGVAGAGETTDAELLRLSREGDASAYAELYTRYYRSALRVAAATASRVDPEDVSAEAFARIWSAIRGGGGPTDAFRPYLYQAVRNVALNAATRAREVPTEPDLVEAAADTSSYQPDEVTVGLTETRQVVLAYTSLPERWRRVLWLGEVEGLSAADIGAKLGISANAAAALAMRAREGLRNAWLHQHTSNETGRLRECDWVGSHLSAFVRNRVSTTQRERIQRHLDECPACSDTRQKATVIWGSLRTVAAIGAIGVGGQLVARFAITGAAGVSGTTGATGAVGAIGTGGGAVSAGGSGLGSALLHAAAPLRALATQPILSLMAGHQAALAGAAASIAVAGVVAAVAVPAIADSAATLRTDTPSVTHSAIVKPPVPTLAPAGSITPTPSPTVRGTEDSIEPSLEPSETPGDPTHRPLPTATPGQPTSAAPTSPSKTPTTTPTSASPTSPSRSQSPTASPTQSASATPSASPTSTPATKPTPTRTPSPTLSPVADPTPTAKPSEPEWDANGCRRTVTKDGWTIIECRGPVATSMPLHTIESLPGG